MSDAELFALDDQALADLRNELVGAVPAEDYVPVSERGALVDAYGVRPSGHRSGGHRTMGLSPRVARNFRWFR